LASRASAASLEAGRVEAVPFSVPTQGLIGPRSHRLTLEVSTGYCVGELKPVLDHVRLVERPKARPEQQAKVSVITVFVRHPSPAPGEWCFGIGLDFPETISLKRPVAGMSIFDGSFSPPRKVSTAR
jgi:hypothetical protein